MKIPVCGLFLLLAITSQAALLITDHVDLTYRYVPATNTWQTFFRHGGGFDNPNLETPLEDAALPARDSLTTDGIRPGDRVVRNNNTAFNFIGAEIGTPYWNLPQSNRAYTWPGIRGSHPSGILLSYSNLDPRLNGLIRRWQAVQLLQVEYSGAAIDPPYFSVHTTSGFGVPTIWMANFDGIDATDRYYLSDVSHNHMNWNFTELGIYRITFRGSAFRASDSLPISSDPHTVTFAIGTLATWRAAHFSGPQIVDPAIGLPLADPDGDGLLNLIEYAFNLDPTKPDAAPMAADTGLSGLPVVEIEEINQTQRLTIEFIRRKAASNPQIIYTAQVTNDLTAATWTDWNTSGTSTITEVIGTDWERVKLIDDQPVSNNAARFARVKIALQPTINY